MVSVRSEPGSTSTYVTPHTVAPYNLVLLVGHSTDIVNAADVACSQANVPFMAASSRGYAGWAFSNLHEHIFVVETKEETVDGTAKKETGMKKIQGVTWERALHASKSVHLKRMSPLLPVLRGKFSCFVIWLEFHPFTNNLFLTICTRFLLH